MAISNDDIDSHCRFGESLGGLDFPHLSDENLDVSRLYDVVNDPAERRDIHAEHPAQMQELKKELDEWLKTTSPAALQKHRPTTTTTQGHSVEDE